MNTHRSSTITSVRSIRHFSLAVFTAAACFMSAPAAHAAEASDRASALEQRLKEVELQNKLAAARFGPSAGPKAGEIGGGDKLAPLASLLQPGAHETWASAIANGLPAISDNQTYLITTKGHLGSQVASARFVRDELDRLIKVGNRVLGREQAEAVFGAAVTVPMALAAAGAVDALAGLFRTDYAAASVEVSNNELGLMLAVHRECRKRFRCNIDSPNLVPVDTGALGARVHTLAEISLAVAGMPPLTGSPQDQATQKLRDSFLTSANTMLAALSKPDAAGVSPMAQAAWLLSIESNLGGVVLLDFVKTTATAITSKRLFSRNAKVHLHLTGLLNVVYQKPDGTLMRSATLKLGESATLDLRKLHSKSSPALQIATSKKL